MIKIAQFGAGFIGKVHGKNLASNHRADLQYIYDVKTEAAVESLKTNRPVKITCWQSE